MRALFLIPLVGCFRSERAFDSAVRDYEYFHSKCNANGDDCEPSDEGTFGSSDAYVYWWTEEDQYYQWSGKYLYSDKPFRLAIEPLVITEKRP